jgi:hypothetical protein
VSEDFTQVLAGETRGVAAIFHEFVIAYYGGDEQDVYAFMEGMEDQKYYLPAVQRLRPLENIHPFLCNGKDAVIQVLDVVSAREEFAREKVMFFVDKDHEEYVGGQDSTRQAVRGEWLERLFITEFYSIESYLVVREAIRLMWAQFTPYGNADVRLGVLLAGFADDHERFARLMRPLMAAVIYLRRRGFRPNLSNVKLERCIDFRNRGQIRRKSSCFREFQVAIGVEAANLRALEIRGELKELEVNECKRWLRGKYELWFLEKFLRAMFGELERERKMKKERRRIVPPRALEQGDLVELLAGRLSYPDSVVGFLTAALAK